MNARRSRVLLCIALVLICAAIPAYFFASYKLADAQYERLVRKKPGNRQQVEELLYLHTTREIEMRESLWGSAYVLRPGEKCMQYMILGREPIDVVYDSEGEVCQIFASYE